MSKPYVLDVKDVTVSEEDISFDHKNAKVTINIKDIIGCESVTTKGAGTSGSGTKISKSSASHIVHYSDKKKAPTWEHGKVYLCGNVGTAQDLVTRVEGKIAQDTDRPKRLLILVNPIGGKQNGKSVLKNTVIPLMKLAKISTDVMISERPKHMVEIITSYNLSQIDGIVILGGDGSVLEVMNHLVRKAQEEAGVDIDDSRAEFAPVQMPVGVIPTGTGNGIANNLYGCYDYATAVLHVIGGKKRMRSCLGIYSGGKFISYSGIVLGYGLFGDMMYQTDKQRWLRKLRYVVVPTWLMLVKKWRYFNTHVTLYNRKKKDENSTETSNELEEKAIDGNFFNLASFNGNCITEDGGFLFTLEAAKVCDQSVFNLLCFKEVSRLGMLSEFVKLFKEDPTAFQREEIEAYTTVGYKVRVEKLGGSPVQASGGEPREEDILHSLLDIDGEIFSFVNNEYEAMYKIDSCTFFSSVEVK